MNSMINRLICNPDFVRIVEAMEKCNGSVRLVGGCVRDSIIGRKTTDIDLATDLVPEKVLLALRDAKIKTVPTGISHGTITAVIKNTPYEITTLRSDTKCDGRHASVVFTDDWLEDASRRDFTFNALYCDKYGKIYDYFSGISDLQNRRVVFIGNAEERVNEDFLRILRVFRFHASICFDNPLSDDIVSVCSKYADNLAKLSKERIRSEFFKLLACTNCGTTLQIMKECGILSRIVPYSMNISSVASTHLAAFSPITKLAVMLKAENQLTDVPAAVKEITDLLRLSKKESKLLLLLLATNIQFPLNKIQKQKYLNKYGVDTYKHLLVTNFLQNTALPESMLLEHLYSADTLVPMTMPVSGKDLENLGYKEGKFLGQILEVLRTTWEQDPANTPKESLLESARALLRAHTKKTT